LNKPYTLILNKAYQPINVESVKKTLGYFIGDEGKALDPVTYELYTFAQWIERHNVRDINTTLRSEKLWILIPEILVLNDGMANKPRGTPFNVSKKKIFDRDRNRCGYCRCDLSNKNRTIDHVNPTSKGGKNSYDNVVACCFDCNSQKGDWPLDILIKSGPHKTDEKGNIIMPREKRWIVKTKLYVPDTNIAYKIPSNKILKSWKIFLTEAS
jgi:hypothetical protein